MLTVVNYYVAGRFREQSARRIVRQLPFDRRIDLTDTQGRGGLLTMPGILTMNKTPIQRGAWMLTRLLGERLGEPPADVPPIKPPQSGSQQLSFRERFVEHRANKACASCHDRIDPLGFAFEAYNEKGGFLRAPNVGTAAIFNRGAA